MALHLNGSTKKRNRDEKKPAQKKKKQITPTNQQRSSISLTDLPSNVLVEILARLPPRTLFVARTVCKTFVSLTTPNSHFINLHSSNAAQIPIFQIGDLHWPSRLIHMPDKVLDYQKSQLKPFFRLPKIDGTDKQYHLDYIGDIRPCLINSCNGLLYLRQIGPGNSRSLSLVCNPVTNEYIIIPEPKRKIRSRTRSFCLGFSPGANQYKLLKLLSRKNAAGLPEFAAQVFVIGSDSWRDIDATLLCRTYFTLDLCRTNVNGLMYWMYLGSWPHAIFSFDFEREKFEDVALPPEWQDEGFITKHQTSIGVLGGCLCLSCNDFDAHRVDLWVMRKYGNRDSWRREFVIDTVGLGVGGGPVYGKFNPLQFLRNGEILMHRTIQPSGWRKNTLVCYDPRTLSLTYFVFDCHRWDVNIKTLTPSLVPLKDALKVEKVLSRFRPRGDRGIVELIGFT